MITALTDIAKLKDALKKLSEASEDLCVAWRSATTPTVDAAVVVEQINRLADMKQQLSLLLLSGPEV